MRDEPDAVAQRRTLCHLYAVMEMVKFGRVVCCWCFFGMASVVSRPALLAQEMLRPTAAPQAKATPAFATAVEAWAMLFQMMERLRTAIEKRELTLIDPEDPVASAAVSSLVNELNKSPSLENGQLKVRWIHFVRGISAMHTASDMGNADAAAALMKQVDEEFQVLQKTADPKLLKEAHELAQKSTCSMHPDVIGKRGEACPKCGMPLDQPAALFLAHLAKGTGQHTVIAMISTDTPLQPGKEAHAILHLRRTMDHPVGLDQLIETHTKKIHLLIVDQSLTDYHHEHPRPNGTPGDYSFSFTPSKPGNYYAWADLRPLPFGLQEYDKAIIAGTGNAEPLTDKATRMTADAHGFHFELTLPKDGVKVGVPGDASLHITRDGKDFAQLEPVMAAFAHIVGFNEDGETVLHMHPIGPPILDQQKRGGPILNFKIYAPKPGFTRLFAQVQVNGQQIFAPFGFDVQK